MAEDDENTRRVLVHALQVQGYRTLEAANGTLALELTLKEKPSLAIIDIEMPEMGGLEVIKRIRDLGLGLPVLVLSGRIEVRDRVEGLKMGADDYLAKPCEAEELLARVAALLRRHGRRIEEEEPVQLGAAKVNLGSNVVVVDGKTLRLTPTEGSILRLLVQYRGKPVSREQIYDLVWGCTYRRTTRALDTHICALRKKISGNDPDAQWIRNISGVGYQLEHELPLP